MSPFVVPTTTSPLILPSYGKILTGPFLNFWILLLMEVFSMYIWLLAPTLLTFDDLFWWLRVEDDIIFHGCFVYDGWCFNLPIFYLIPWVNWWLNLLTRNASWWYYHCWNPLVCKPSNRFTLFTHWRLVVFGHSNGIIFIGIVWCDSYYVKNHPPKDFQVHIFPFDWVLGAVTFQLPLLFHLRFSYSKPHGLTWDQKGSLHWCLKNLCSIFQLNLMTKSKVIGLLV